MSPEVGSRSKYYTGEAYWALTRLHRAFPDEGFGEVADRIGHYLATERDEVEDLWPPIPDHWAAYGLAETAQFPERDPDRPLTDAELAYARRLAGLFGSQVRWISQQAGPWGSVVRGTKVPRGGGYGVGGEALAALWRAAGSDARLEDARAGIGERAECLAGLAIEVQDDGSDAGQPDLTDGAWFIDGVTRMDDQQHATSALLGTLAVVEAGPGTGHDEPNRWLWALALLATLNPLFVGPGPAAPARPGESGRRWPPSAGSSARCSWCSPPRRPGPCSTRSTSARRRPGWPSGSSAPWRGSSAWPAGRPAQAGPARAPGGARAGGRAARRRSRPAPPRTRRRR